MVKSSSLVFVLLFAFMFRLELFSLRLVGVIVLICIGVLLMVATETQFVFGGFILSLSASALAGLRWSLTHLLLKHKKLGLDNPVATIFWLSPIMGLSLAVVSASIDRWSDLHGSRFFDSFGTTLKTCALLTLPGVLAFCMILSEYLYVISSICTETRPEVFVASYCARELSRCLSQESLRKSQLSLWQHGSSATNSHLSI